MQQELLEEGASVGSRGRRHGVKGEPAGRHGVKGKNQAVEIGGRVVVSQGFAELIAFGGRDLVWGPTGCDDWDCPLTKA